MRDPETGRRKRKWHSFTGNKRQAQVECARLVSEMKVGTYVEPNKTTLAQYLDRWLDDARSCVTPKTHERYTQICHKNVAPLLGAVPLAKLRPEQIAQAYAKALASGRRKGSGGLSPRTVRQMHAIIKSALAQAVKWEILIRNPAAAVRGPKVGRAAMQTYDLEQTAELIEAARGRRVFIPILLAVLGGLRRGEIAALRWRHVDLSTAQLAVIQSAEQTKAGVRYKEPKSGRGRTIALSATLVTELKAHQEWVRFLERYLIAPKPVARFTVTLTIFRQWLRSAVLVTRNRALPRIRFHDLRHAHATHLLASGVHPKVASERLGHSKVGITLDLYSHVLPNMQADAAAIVDDALRAVLRKRGAEGG